MGYTQLPNDILDQWVSAMGNAELRVTLTVVRKTIGFQKQSDEISISQFQDMTGMSKSSTLDGVKSCLEKGYIEKVGEGRRGVGIYQLGWKITGDEPSKYQSDTGNLLYVIRAGKFYKIGVTSNIENRKGSIQNAQPEKIEVEFIMAVSKAYDIETFLHEQFEIKRVRGEWFLLNSDDVNYIIDTVTRISNGSPTLPIQSGKAIPRGMETGHTKEMGNKSKEISASRTRDRSYMGIDLNRPTAKEESMDSDKVLNSELVKFVVSQIGRATAISKHLQQDLSSKTNVPDGNHTIVYKSAVDMFDTDPMYKEFVVERIKSFKSLLHPPRATDVLINLCRVGKPPVSELGVKQWPGYHFWKKDRFAEPSLSNVKKVIDYGAPPDEVQDDTD